MNVKKIDFASAKESYKDYEYALIYMMSSIILKRTSEIEKIKWDECLEARFFDKDRELHMICANECFSSIISDEASDTFIVRNCRLKPGYSELGKKLIVKQYVGKDEDGQSFISLTRLCGIE